MLLIITHHRVFSLVEIFLVPSEIKTRRKNSRYYFGAFKNSYRAYMNKDSVFLILRNWWEWSGLNINKQRLSNRLRSAERNQATSSWFQKNLSERLCAPSAWSRLRLLKCGFSQLMSSHGLYLHQNNWNEWFIYSFIRDFRHWFRAAFIRLGVRKSMKATDSPIAKFQKMLVKMSVTFLNPRKVRSMTKPL